MNELKFIIPGKPTAWSRALPARGNFSSVKMIDKQKKIKLDYAFQLKSQLPDDRTIFPLSCPLELRCYFYLSISGSWSKKKKAEHMLQPHVFRPDLDNMVKFIEDVLTSCLIIHDDCQIYKIEAEKRYDSQPRTEIVICY